jgi:hypothetical protein
VGGGSTPQDAGQPTGTTDAAVVTEGGVAACPGAALIYSAAGSGCADCVATFCCGGATACPNDPQCQSIAICVGTMCLAGDPSCVNLCESATSTAAQQEFITFRQCVGTACPGCPSIGTANL